MLAVSTFLGPTSVVASLRCRITSADEECLIVAKLGQLEAYRLLPEGVRHHCTLDIWGSVKSLHAVYRPGATNATLCVITDLPYPRASLVDYDPEHHLKVTQAIPLESTSQPSELCTSAVDPSGHIIAILAHVGIVKVIWFNGREPETFDIRVNHLNIIDVCFLPVEEPTLAILYQDHARERHVVAYELDVTQKDLSSQPFWRLPGRLRDENANFLVPIPAPGSAPAGVLVLGGRKCEFYELVSETVKSKRAAAASPRAAVPDVNWPYGAISSCAVVDDTNVLISDVFGRLALLHLTRSGRSKVEMGMTFLGETSSASCITYLNAAVMFLGSHYGDSHILRIEAEPRNGSHLSVIETFKNIAPIVDAVVESKEDQHMEPRLVTCSGGANTGSLRVIRNAAEFLESCILVNLSGVMHILPFRESFSTEWNKFAILSTSHESHLVEFLDNDVAEVPESLFPGVLRNTPTLAVGNMAKRLSDTSYDDCNTVVQVTTDCVVTFDANTRLECSRWTPRGFEIVAASINPTQVCIALQGGDVILLHLDHDVLQQSTQTNVNFEISAVSITPLGDDKFSNEVVVGSWNENKLIVLDAARLVSSEGVSIDLPHVPRSILRCRLGGAKPYNLFVGLGNGSLLVLEMENRCEAKNLRKVFALGSRPVYLSQSRDGSIFACGSRAVVLYRDKDRLQHSPVGIKDVVCASQLHTANHPESLIFATASDIVIGRIQELSNLQIQTIPLGLDNPKRLAYHPDLKAYGVICSRENPVLVGTPESGSSSFKLMDETTFEHLNNYSCEPDEEATAISVEQLTVDGGTSSPYFLLGTVRYVAESVEPSTGRLLVFQGAASRSSAAPSGSPILWKMAETTVTGCVFRVTSICGLVAAAVNTSLQLFQLSSISPPGTAQSGVLKMIASWDHNCLLTNLVARGEYLILADALQSITVLKLVNERLKVVARDYTPLWPTAIAVDDQGILGADNDCNLFKFKILQSSLERQGQYHFGDFINKIVRGSITSSPSAVNDASEATHLVFTSGGRISVVSECGQTLSDNLYALQRNMAGSLVLSSGLSHTKWRSPCNSLGASDLEESAGFIDLDFLKLFLALKPSSKEEADILSGKREPERLQQSATEIRGMIEGLL